MRTEGEGFIDISYVVVSMVCGAFVSSAPLVVLVDCFSTSRDLIGVKYCGNLLFLSVLFACVFFGFPAFVLSALYVGNHFWQNILRNCGSRERITALHTVKLVLTAALFAALSYYYETRITAFSPFVARLYLVPFATYSAILVAFIPAHVIATILYRNSNDQQTEYEQV